jgi:hypothetical protein
MYTKNDQLTHAQALIVQSRIARAVERIAYLMEVNTDFPTMQMKELFYNFKDEQNTRFEELRRVVQHASSPQTGVRERNLDTV